jgi:sugar phosphate isomerase/epimerase
MKLQLACADFTFPLLEHDKVLKLISLLEVQGVDIGLFEGRSHLWPSREFADIPHRAGELRRKTADAGLTIADVFLQAAPGFQAYPINHPEISRRQQARELFLKTLDYAAAAGARHVTCLPGVRFAGEARDRWLGRAAEELAWRIEMARRRDLSFSTEVHLGSLAETPDEALDLLARVPGLTLTLDYTHFIRNGIPDSAVHALLPYARHFHIRGACPGRIQASFQRNTIDYRAICQRLRKSAYAGWLGLEFIWVEWENSNECDNVSETIQFRDFIRKAWDEA